MYSFFKNHIEFIWNLTFFLSALNYLDIYSISAPVYTPPKYTKNDQMILETKSHQKKTSNNLHVLCLFPPPSNQHTKNSFWPDFTI